MKTKVARIVDYLGAQIVASAAEATGVNADQTVAKTEADAENLPERANHSGLKERQAAFARVFGALHLVQILTLALRWQSRHVAQS